MPQQQLLLIILAAIIIGVAIYVGIIMFANYNVASNKDAITSDLQDLGADAYAFIYRPTMMGGGGGSYVSYAIAPTGAWGTNNANATYSVASRTATQIVFTATSKVVTSATITMTFDNFGKVVSGPTATGF
ncbi:MAG: hypothetical protein ACHQQQ_11415 [Bacteroidota bacterium]